MKIFHSILLSGWVVALVAGQCRTRVEVRDMSRQQLRDYISAVITLERTQDQDIGSILDYWSSQHDMFFGDIHVAPFFFPWHRYLLYQLETSLLQINPKVVLPYWDWTYDAAAPSRSIVLTDTWFGPPQQSRGCLRSGNFRNYQIQYPEARCMERQFNTRNTFVSRTELNRLMRISRTQQDLYDNINIVPHGLPHVTIGGDMAMGYSPNDPLFYLHHAMVDKIWYDWQKSGHGNDYQYPLDAPMPVFNEPVGDILDPNSPSYCIKYAPPKAISGISVAEAEDEAIDKDDNLEIELKDGTKVVVPLPIRFVYKPVEIPKNPLGDVPDHFLRMHNTTRDEFNRVRDIVHGIRFGAGTAEEKAGSEEQIAVQANFGKDK